VHEPEEWSEEDPLIQALRAPGTPDELARETEYAEAFRAAAGHRRLRLVGRAGVAGGAVAVTIALSAGVAAAYTNALPEPVQRLAHRVLGPVGVPAVHAGAHEARRRPHAPTPTASPTVVPHPGDAGSPSPTPTPTRTASPRPTRPATATPSGTPSPTATASTSPTAAATTPSAGASPTATSSPTEQAGVPRPARIALSVSGKKVGPQGTVTVSGWVTSRTGAPVPGRTVKLRAKVAGGAWRLVASSSTGSGGTVSLQTPPLPSTTTLRLVAGKVRSHTVRVVVVPTLAASYADGAVSVAVAGGQPGDKVVLLRAGRQVAVGRLASDGSVSFAVQQKAKPVKLALRLPGTAFHAQALGKVTVPAKS
jgi:hypothetical protein